MREILFRGKLKTTGEWAFGNLNITIKGTNIITPDDTPIGKYGAVIPGTVGQYTGLTDKNGTKIFEGDILRAEINGGPYDKFVFPVGVIAFENGCFGNKDRKRFTPLSSYASRVSFEVIGNIHDNSELLKGDCDNA